MDHRLSWIGFFALAVAACGGSTSSTTSAASSGGGGHAAQSSSSGASGGGGGHAAGSTSSSAGSGGSSSAGDGCYVLTGAGSSQECAWDTSPDASCGAQTPGSCPSADLVGCCLFMGASGESADCYYSSSSAQTGMDDCEGSGGTWQTTAP